MNDLPRVSVVLCTYNRAARGWLQEAIQSVLDQTFRDWELIVVDDGSTDGTGEIVAAFTDPRIRYHWQPNAGLAAARNTGITQARGEYVSFLDDDDRFLPERLALHVLVLDEQPDIGAVIGGFAFVDEAGVVQATESVWHRESPTGLRSLLLSDPPPRSAVTVRSCLLDTVRGFDATFRNAEDVDLCYRLAQAGCQFGSSQQVDYEYRIHGTSQTRDLDAPLKYRLAALDKVFAMSGLAPEVAQLHSQSYGRAHLMHAERLCRARASARGAEQLKRAIELDPELAAHGYAGLAAVFAFWLRSPYQAFQPLTRADVLAALPNTIGRRAVDRSLLKVESRVRFYAAYKERDAAAVRREWWWLARHDARWLLNRGNWASLVKVHLPAPREAQE